MKSPGHLTAIALLAAACAARPARLSPTAAAPQTREPTAAPTVAVAPSAPASIARIVALPGNLATGEPAPDFTARVLGGDTFRLSAQRGSPVLLLPTVVGCGDCIFALREISVAYSDFRGRGLKAVILSLYPDDTPTTWQEYADYFAEPEFIWGVVDSTDFARQYNITTLGTTLLVDRGGRVVFRSEYPLFADGFRRLFDLVLQ